MAKLQHQSLPLTASVSLFLADRKARGFTAKTLRYYDDSLRLFTTHCEAQGVVAVRDLAPVVVRGYINAQRERGIAPMTVRAYVRAVKTFLRWLFAEGLMPQDIMQNVPMPKAPKQILPAFRTEEIQSLVMACRDLRDRAAVLLLLDTGVRAAEFCNLRIGDVDLPTGAVAVKQGKGQKDRTVWLGVAARKAVMLYLAHNPGAPSDPVFRSERGGGALLTNGLRQWLRRLGQVAGIANCHPHTFRRTFALTCLRNGVNVYVLARLMGHSDLEILKQYLALVDGDAQAAHAAASPADHLVFGKAMVRAQDTRAAAS